jgi:hypothetical protein
MIFSKFSFKVFHIESKRIVMEFGSHSSSVAGIIPLYKSTRLVSCLEDGSVNFCGSVRHKNMLPRVCRPPPRKSRSEPMAQQPAQGQLKSSGLFHKMDKVDICILGTMSIHSGAVCQIVSLSEHSFATCGKEGYVILWKVVKNFRKNLLDFLMANFQNFRMVEWKTKFSTQMLLLI